MGEPRPLLSAAFLCEKLLTEPGNVFSAIRIVDTWTRRSVQLKAVSSGPESDVPAIDLGNTTLQMAALIAVKAGGTSGHHVISIVIENSEGKRTPYPQEFPVDFTKNDPGEGAALSVQLLMPATSSDGRYWIDVLWDGTTLTRIPFRLVTEPALA